jgi:catalase
MTSGDPDSLPKRRPAPLPPGAIILRLGLIGAILGGIALLFAFAGGWLSPRLLTPDRFVDGFQQVNGDHPGFRRNHAKGLCFTGYFTSNGQGAPLSRALIFQAGRFPVIGRFSLAGGLPYVADAATMTRGLAIRFQLPDGEEWRTAMINLPVFPVSTPQAFYDQLIAATPNPATGKADPARMQAFLATHPETARAIKWIRAAPISSGFENTTFNSLNAFRFINGAGAAAFVRWSMNPVEPYEPVEASDLAPSGKNYLFDSLIVSLHTHPLQWHMIVTVAQPGDAIDNATIAWPDGRQQVDVGTLTIDQISSEDVSPARDMNFDPLILPDGIAPSADPLLSARSAVYSESFTRRGGEHKDPAAVSAADTAN